MKIRSITCFINPALIDYEMILKKTNIFVANAKRQFQEAGFEVQSTRLASTPFTDYFPKDHPDRWAALAKQNEEQAVQAGFNYLSLGPIFPDQIPDFHSILDMLAATRNVFLSAIIADPSFGISLPAIQQTACIIRDCAGIEKDGFANLRFAALANVKPFTPFFPAAYSLGDQTSFALAIQAADDVLNIFQQAASLNQARQDLLDILQKQTSLIEEISNSLDQEFRVEFKGIDLSPAPFPKDWCSIGGALEALGLHSLGNPGSLTAAAFLADILQHGNWKKTGFNGIMLPVLEDSILADRSGQGTLNIYDLLLYSAVCGTGLDTVPLPGDIHSEEIEPLLLDIAALAIRLDKPLTARLMPIPGKKAGDITEFQFDFFANGRVMDYQHTTLQGKFKSSETFLLTPRKL